MPSHRSRVAKLETALRPGERVEVWMPCDDEPDMYRSPQYPAVRLSLTGIEARSLPPGTRQVVVLHKETHGYS